MFFIDLLRKRREKKNCLEVTGVHQVQSRTAFNILMSNFSKTPLKLIKYQCVATAEDHPEPLTETDISHCEMLGIAESDNMYRKRDHNANYIKFINKNLSDSREASIGEQEEEPIEADTVELGVDKKSQPIIRNIVRKHEYLWS